ncbi:MAG: hypothetical protein IPK80_34785 [Nannocystis sp.]|nr:hypothetical protein [Nannocystis sp.]
MTTRRPQSPSEANFHSRWLGMIQREGLVVSESVLTAAGVMHQRGAAAQQTYRARLLPPPDPDEGEGEAPLQLPSLPALFFDLLHFTPEDLALGAELPEALHVLATDAAQSVLLRPSAALRRARPAAAAAPTDDPFADPPGPESTHSQGDPFADPESTDHESSDHESTDHESTDHEPADPDEPPPSAALPDLAETSDTDPELSDAARVGRGYLALVWDLADPDTGYGPAAIGRDLDRPDQATTWSYPPTAKFERLLRHTRIPIGLLTNRTHVRLLYAPHGETSGSLTFDLSELAKVDGRPMLDAFLALLGRDRWLTQAEAHRLPALLAQSRRQQAEVTERLADQVFDALQALLSGFEAAAERDGAPLLHQRVSEGHRSHGTGEVYAGLLTVLLRLVFTLYAEDRGLLPVEHPIYQAGYSVLGLFDQLQADQSAHPDAMDRRFGAWSRLLASWRAIYDGVHHHGHEGAPLLMPPRRGHLFDPNAYPFLEGRPAAGELTTYAARAAVQVPSVDDGTLYRALDGLIFLHDGKARQRLSYRALDVEQIGSVYEALMGYDVVRLTAPAVRMRARRAKGVWLSAAELLAVPAAGRAKWLKESVGLDKGHASAIAAALAAALKSAPTKDPAAQAELVLSLLVDHAGKGFGQRAAAGRLVIQPGDERKRTSSHYTPQSLTRQVVRRTLAPILRTIEAQTGAPPTSETLLSLKIVDPAVGSGAFLVEVVRQLADHVVAAWQREGSYEAMGSLLAAQLSKLAPEARPADGSDEGADPVIAARRLVAQRCVYGVDKNPYAVNLAKLSLWLVTLSRHLPFTFVDHALRCGDSLVGLTLAGARAFDWRAPEEHTSPPAKKPGKTIPNAATQESLLTGIVAKSLTTATDLRHQIMRLAAQDGEAAVLAREDLLQKARDALDEAKLIADLCVGAFFSAAKDKDRLTERQRRFDLVLSWVAERELDPKSSATAAALARLKSLQTTLIEAGKQAPFHWMLEFPEVFFEGRKDPLVLSAKGKRVAYFDAVVGNPPFAGKNGVLAAGGDNYIDWLKTIHPGAHGNADLCAHFFRRAALLLGPHGTLGLVATNTIGQGDTRSTGLAALLAEGARIYDATVDLRWPAPGAAVTVSIVHAALGLPAQHTEAPVLRTPNASGTLIEARTTTVINSRLVGRPERADPVTLRSNADLSFQGSIVLGQGFTLTPEEQGQLIAKNKRNADLIKPYLGGAELNRNPDQGFDRYVIDFGDLDLADAEKWPDLLKIVRERVKPERDKLKDNADGRRRKEYWWQWGRRTPALEAALAKLPRCLVTSRVTKHLCFSWQPSNRVLNEKIVAVVIPADTLLATLQSRVHGAWSWALSSTLKTDLNYAPSDCFQNFPFPAPDPRTEHPFLEDLGKRLDAQRSAFLLFHNIGLTTLYNLLLGFDTAAAIADPRHKLHAPAADPRLADLRQLHLDLDRAVLTTYAHCLSKNSQDPAERALAPVFAAVAVPPYQDPRLPSLTPEARQTLATFSDALLDALMALNEARARQEAAR